MSGLHRAGLRIDLRAPTIFSAAAATTGGHASLDAVPGAALLGLAAAWQEAWQEGLPEPVWTVLRSGGVRFGPGYPIDGQGRVLLPVPRALHKSKASTDGRRSDERILYNLSSGTTPSGLQLSQVRDGFLAEGENGLEATRPRKTFVMKTAVDPESGTAMDAMLFGYEALAAGQSFYAEIEADADALDGAAFEALVGTLASREGLSHRMGRSRAAEFGAVTIRRVPERPAIPVRSLGERLVIWALSDIALVDANGQPAVDPATIELPELSYRPDISFVGTRRYAPYVGRWRMSDMERHVISAGSVLVFTGKGAERAGERLQAHGLGIERAAGLGRVWVNPLGLDTQILTALPDWHRLPVAPSKSLRSAPVGNALFAWLDARTRTRGSRDKSDQAVAAAVETALAAYRSAEAYSGQRPDGFAGPSKSQWNQVAGMARDARDPDALDQVLFGVKGIVSGQRDRLGQVRTDPAWGWPVAPDRDHATTLRELVADFRNDGVDVARTLAAVAQGVASALGGLKARSNA